MTRYWRLIVIPVVCVGWLLAAAGGVAQEDETSATGTETSGEETAAEGGLVSDFMDWVESSVENVEIEYEDLQPASGPSSGRIGGGGDGGSSGGHGG